MPGFLSSLATKRLNFYVKDKPLVPTYFGTVVRSRNQMRSVFPADG